jgi:DNA uptake protein ComE-like DNA-binding protein
VQRRLSPLDPRPIAVLAGIWAALAIPRLDRRDRPPEPAWTQTRETAAPCARELRRWPGIGPRRAQAIVEHRWIHGPDFELEDVPGIGPLTARAVRAARDREP